MRRLFRFLWRPAVSLWGTVVVAVVYPLSAGPAIWLIWNVHLPDWAGLALHYFYNPLIWAINGSDFTRHVWNHYAEFWVSPMAGGTATRMPPDPATPPYVVEVFGTLLGAWLIWSFVRWINQRNV